MKMTKGLKIAIPVMTLIASAIPFTVSANEVQNPGTESPAAVVEEENKSTYSKFTGKVTEVRDNTLGTTFIRLEEGEQVYDFRVGENTILVTSEGVKPISDIKEGDELTVYYIMPLVNILIFPPQMEASVFVKEPAADSPLTIYVGRFDENLVSDDNYVKINEGGEKTKIYNSKGELVTEDIKGKDLAIVFGPMTMSIPGQTTPEIIVILDVEKDEASAESNTEATDNGVSTLPIELTDEDKSNLSTGIVESLKGGGYIVMNETIEAPEAFALGNYVMVPLRAIAEAAGYEVKWDEGLQAITVGFHVTLTIDKDYYTFARMAPIELGQAPVNVDGVTYVPMEFFDRVLGLEINVADGNIVVSQKPQIHD